MTSERSIAVWRTLGWFLPGLLAHGLGLLCFVNWRDIVFNPPLHFTDYATHYAHVEAVSVFLRSGQLWGYSPYFHAGYAAGTLFDLDNKAVEVFSFGLHALGLSLPDAYDLVMLTLLALAPLSVFAAGRAAGLGARASGLALLLTLALWYGDHAIRWMWQGSILAFAAAALGSLWVGAVFWRWASREAPARAWYWLLWFGLGPLLFWVHPEAFVTLAVIIGAGLVAYARHWHWREWAILAAWSAWVVLFNWPWLGTVLAHRDAVRAAPFLQGGLAQLGADLVSLHGPARVAVLIVAAAGIAAWRRARRKHWLALAITILVWLALAYAGAALGLGLLQPYRFILPVLGLATLPAAAWLAARWQSAPRRAVFVMLAILAAAAPALYVGRPRDLRYSDGTPYNYLGGPQPVEHAICSALSVQHLQSGRVLTNDFRLGAWLPSCSGAQVIGGPFYEVWTREQYANAAWESMFNRPVARIGEGEMRQLLERYNVHWVVVNDGFGGRYTLNAWQKDHPGVLMLIGHYGAFALFAVSEPSTWFEVGAGDVRAAYNRLEVRSASPDEVILKYRWLPTLRADPPLPLRPVWLGDDPLPFIAVSNGPVTDFDIVQIYE